MTAGKKSVKHMTITEDVFSEEHYESKHALYKSLMEAFEASGLTQDELAELTGIDKSTISKIFRGRRGVSIKTGSRLAAAMRNRLLPTFKPYDEIGNSNQFSETPADNTMTITSSAQSGTYTEPANRLLSQRGG
jgi:transcriptional regulator with XRE-family HTH domain